MESTRLGATGLWHYTCSHGKDSIIETGLVYPAVRLRRAADLKAPLQRMANMISQLVWLTDLPSIIPMNRNQVGLTMNALDCDRTEARFEVLRDDPPIYWWMELRERWPVDIVNDLERLDGARPQHWFVSRGPVPVKFSPNHG